MFVKINDHVLLGADLPIKFMGIEVVNVSLLIGNLTVFDHILSFLD